MCICKVYICVHGSNLRGELASYFPIRGVNKRCSGQKVTGRINCSWVSLFFSSPHRPVKSHLIRVGHVLVPSVQDYGIT